MTAATTTQQARRHRRTSAPRIRTQKRGFAKAMPMRWAKATFTPRA